MNQARTSRRPKPIANTADPQKAKETLSIAAVVALGDIPVLLDTPTVPKGNTDLGRLIAAIDGEATVATLASTLGLDAHQVRAWIAELADQGSLTFERRVPRTSQVENVLSEKARRSPDYWLQGLKPRTR